LKEVTCPNCGGTDIAIILWGLANMDSELNKELEDKKVVLGGCCVSGNDPDLECNDCNHRWRKQ